MRVFLTVNFSPWSRYHGGGQRSTHFLACALARRGHEVTVVFTKPPWERVKLPALPYRIEWAALLDVASRRAAPLRPLTALSVAHTVRRLARRGAPSVVHAQGEEGALVPYVLACPLVLTPRYPSYPSELAARAGRPLRRAGLWLSHPKLLALQAAARRAAFVCPTSQSSAQMAQRALGVDEARIRVIPNGVDPTFFERERRPDAASGPLLFFGRIQREKGVDVLVEAFAQSAHGERKLCIVGQGSDLPWLRRAVRARGLEPRTEFWPWERAEVLAERLAGAALAVLPSREESFGNAMLEAMAAATPLVSTTAGSVPEVVQHGETGLLVPPNDARALRGAIATLLAEPARAEALGRAGRAGVRARYSWDAVAAQYEEVYAEAGQPRRAAASAPAEQVGSDLAARSRR